MKRLVLILIAIFLVASPAFAQKSFDMRYSEAVEYYTSRQYDKAITVLEAAKKSPGVTSAQITKANKLINQCKASKQKLSDLNLSKEAIAFLGDGQTDSIYVTSGKKWEVTSSPEWVSVWTEADILYAKTEANDTGEERKGMIEVSMGKERTAYVLVTQEKRLEARGSVLISTIPDRAFIFVDREQGMLSENFEMREGRHTIRIEKSGYERKDTTIVLGREVEKGETAFVFRLTPTFATISVEIKPEEGYSFDGFPTLDVSGNNVNLHPGAIKSFNVDREISYYEVYEDNLIPLHPGQYVLKVEADGFLPQTRDISISKGSQSKYEFTLTPICGTLSVSDEEYAEGATVLLDGVEIGTVPVNGIRVKSGKHVLSFIKEGFMTAQAEYEIEIPENKEARFKTSMERFAAYTISSEPAYCKVYLNGKYQGATPVRLILNEGEHTVRFEKNGFYPLEKKIKTDFSEVEHADSISLVQAFPLLVTADRDSLGITISQGRGKNKFIYADGVKTPATVEIPISNKPYKIELTRSNLKKAWRGNMLFNSPERNHKNILSWGTKSPVLSGEWYLLPPVANFSNTDFKKGFKRLGDFKFATLALFPGMSTSLINASLYWESDIQENCIYPEVPATSGLTSIPALTPESEGYQNTTWIPALTLLFLNEEFRMGGAILPNLDVNMLATYAWYPSLQFLHSLDPKLSLTHMSGHDVFLGAELNSRIPVFNVHVKAGMQAFFGEANIRRPGTLPKERVEYRYVTVPYTVQAVNDIQFVVSLGFTLGGGESKGQNILRIF